MIAIGIAPVLARDRAKPTVGDRTMDRWLIHTILVPETSRPTEIATEVPEITLWSAEAVLEQRAAAVATSLTTIRRFAPATGPVPASGPPIGRQSDIPGRPTGAVIPQEGGTIRREIDPPWAGAGHDRRWAGVTCHHVTGSRPPVVGAASAAV